MASSFSCEQICPDLSEPAVAVMAQQYTQEQIAMLLAQQRAAQQAQYGVQQQQPQQYYKAAPQYQQAAPQYYQAAPRYYQAAQQPVQLQQSVTLTPDAHTLVATAHWRASQRMSKALGRSYDGLTAASRAARRQGILDAKWAKKLARLDIAYAVVRHISEENILEFERDLSAFLAQAHGPMAFVADVAVADSEDYEREYFGEPEPSPTDQALDTEMTATAQNSDTVKSYEAEGLEKAKAKEDKDDEKAGGQEEDKKSVGKKESSSLELSA